MLKALVWKESRELAPLVALAAAAQLLAVLPHPIRVVDQTRSEMIPFVGSGLQYWFIFVGGAAAIALGFWQTVGESARGTFLFLLHRPLTRPTAVATKLAVGTGLTLLIAGIPILAFALWAALPGTHASPFFWSMTLATWLAWIQLPLVYLAAFLSGIRPGRWLGSRALPLVAILPLIFAIQVSGFWSPSLLVGLTLLAEACYLYVVMFIFTTRDFS